MAAVSSGEKKILASEAGGGVSDPCKQPGARPPPPHVGWRADRRAARGGGSRPRGDLGRRAGGASERPSGGVPSPGVERETRARVASPRRGAPGARGAARVVPRRRRRRARARAARIAGRTRSHARRPRLGARRDHRARRLTPKPAVDRRGRAGGAEARAGGSGVERTPPRANLAGAQNPAGEIARAIARPVRPVPGAIASARRAPRANALTKRSRARGGGSRRTRVSMSTAACRAERAHGSLRGGEGMRSRLALPRSGCSSEERRGDARATSARGR